MLPFEEAERPLCAFIHAGKSTELCLHPDHLPNCEPTIVAQFETKEGKRPFGELACAINKKEMFGDEAIYCILPQAYLHSKYGVWAMHFAGPSTLNHKELYTYLLLQGPTEWKRLSSWPALEYFRIDLTKPPKEKWYSNPVHFYSTIPAEKGGKMLNGHSHAITRLIIETCDCGRDCKGYREHLSVQLHYCQPDFEKDCTPCTLGMKPNIYHDGAFLHREPHQVEMQKKLYEDICLPMKEPSRLELLCQEKVRNRLIEIHQNRCFRTRGGGPPCAHFMHLLGQLNLPSSVQKDIYSNHLMSQDTAKSREPDFFALIQDSVQYLRKL